MPLKSPAARTIQLPAGPALTPTAHTGSIWVKTNAHIRAASAKMDAKLCTGESLRVTNVPFARLLLPLIKSDVAALRKSGERAARYTMLINSTRRCRCRDPIGLGRSAHTHTCVGEIIIINTSQLCRELVEHFLANFSPSSRWATGPAHYILQHSTIPTHRKPVLPAANLTNHAYSLTNGRVDWREGDDLFLGPSPASYLIHPSRIV